MNTLTIQEYQKLAKRTCPSLGTLDQDYLHMVLGIITEIGEILDIFKKKIAYKKPIDLVNLGEELGDLSWYIVNYLTFSEKNVNYDLYDEDVKIDSEEGVIENYQYILTFNIPDIHYILYTSKRVADFYNLDFEEILYKNIEKLKVRYPDKFTEEAALNRDLESERKTLEK